MVLRILSSLVFVLALSPARAAKEPLTTVAEQSGYVRTGRFDEVERLCKAYADQWPDAVRCVEFGRTPEQRPMLALVASRAQALTPAEATAKNIPVVLIQGGIHAGEIDGKDAGFLALREFLQGRVAPGALERITLVFVPVFNVDGHERFGRWNRPNQVGPEEMGWRVTSQNLNLNRDYAKADAPEMQAMLRLLNDWNPIVYVDLHVTDGAQFQHDIANLAEPVLTGDTAMRAHGAALVQEVNLRLAKGGALPLSFYPSFRESGNPASGFEVIPSPPRFSTGYWATRNRLALLVETHSWKDYRTRVRLTHDTVVAVVELTAREGRAWLEAARAADEKARSFAGTTMPLAFQATQKHEMIDFKGYAYTYEPSAISGALALRYDPKKPQIWRVPLYDEVVPTVQVVAPGAGYIVPAGHAKWIAERLSVHGIEHRVIETDLGSQQVEAFRATQVTFSPGPFEGRTTARLSGSWAPESRAVSKGSLFVPVNQPKARLVMALLEPQSADSYAAWGFFNGHFEPKEYMEDYVAEDIGREMLAKRPEIAAEFRKRLADPEFAKNPKARLEFFYRLHPSWDERLNLYPIVRTAREP